jgi:apolipoprotein D and lipocalin family protein
MPWAHLLGLASPMLPGRWRQRVSPTTAATVISLGAPLIEHVFAPRRYPPLPTALQIDLARYAGTWYEIARLPEPFEARCDGQPTAHYRLSGGVLQVTNRCPDGAGGERVARGVARPTRGSGNAKLKLSMWPSWLRWLPAAWSPYWVLHVDEGYHVALVGHPNRRLLWVLSRRPRLGPAQLGELVRLAAEHGFPVDRLRVVQPD